MSELSLQSTQAPSGAAKNSRNRVAYAAIIAISVAMLACIVAFTAIAFVLIDQVPWHHLWEYLLQSA
jgi:hypothetical protein